MIIDSKYTSLEKALRGSAAPKQVLNTLALIDVSHVSFDGELHSGQLVMHADLAQEVKDIFAELLTLRFPIQKVIPIIAYDWDDDASMADNNTSAFNYRRIIGTDRVSNHSFGRAIDINPLQNPYYALDGKIYPKNAQYSVDAMGTIRNGGDVVSVFKRYGWEWLGEREQNKDLQHFQKV